MLAVREEMLAHPSVQLTHLSRHYFRSRGAGGHTAGARGVFPILTR
jgi:hypothetical protein